jgi:hypothetical protein
MPLNPHFRSIINDAMKADAHYRRYVISALDVLDRKPTLVARFENREIAIPFMDIYCQNDNYAAIHFEDLAMAAIAWQHILRGKLIYRFIEVGEAPQADKAKFHNKAILIVAADQYRARNNLYCFKSVDFWGGTQGADGFIRFAEPLIRNFKGRPLAKPGEASPPDILQPPISGSCTDFPLEVGYCRPDQLEMHLLKTGCVARFPYGYNILVFLEAMRKSSVGKTDSV